MKYSVFYHRVKGESAEFTSAGIIATDKQGREIRRIFDVSTEFDAFEKFVQGLNEGGVCPEHLDSMLEDYYAEHC